MVRGSLRTGLGKDPLCSSRRPAVANNMNEWWRRKPRGKSHLRCGDRGGTGQGRFRMQPHNPSLTRRFSGSEPGVLPLGRGSQCHLPHFTLGAGEVQEITCLIPLPRQFLIKTITMRGTVGPVSEDKMWQAPKTKSYSKAFSYVHD